MKRNSPEESLQIKTKPPYQVVGYKAKEDKLILVMKKNIKVVYSRTNVSFNDFIDLVSVFKPEKLSEDFIEYRKMLDKIYQDNENIINIVELVRNIEVNDYQLNVDNYNSISAVIFKNGVVKYVACY